MGNSTGKQDSSAMGSDTSAEEIVTNAIRTYPVVIFSKTYCPYCHSAKSDIVKAGQSVSGFQEPKIFELDNMGVQGSQIQSYLATLTGRRTVPNVFIGGTTVGGGSEVAALAASGTLEQTLSQAAALLTGDKPADADADVGADKGSEPKEDEPETFMKNEIASNAVVVFSKSYCPYCELTKRLLAEQMGTIGEDPTSVVVHELDNMGERGQSIQNHLFTLTGQRTVPNIFISSNHIGGNDDLMELHGDGKLVPLLQKAFLCPNDEPSGDCPEDEQES